jgi:hypothetical protein
LPIFVQPFHTASQLDFVHFWEEKINSLVFRVSSGWLTPGRLLAQKKRPVPVFQQFSMMPRDRLMLEKAVKGQLQRELGLFDWAYQAKSRHFKRAIISLH